MMPIGGTSATGALKAAMFEDWPAEALLHVSAPAPDVLAVAAGRDRPRPLAAGADAAAILSAFAPEIILYRPVAERPVLHDLAMALVRQSPAGLAVWLMDDWPARLAAEDPEAGAKMDADLRALLDRAALRLAISPGMAAAFGARYDAPFDWARNGVRPADWPEKAKRQGGGAGETEILLRYSGSLAPDMTLHAVAETAQAVAALRRQGVRLRFEVRSQPHWLAAAETAFDGLDGVTVEAADLPDRAYRAWLQEADILLVAYNFDEETLRYVRYSFANKVPEALAAGAAVLAHGPTEIETIATLESLGAAEMVTAPGREGLIEALRRLTSDPARRQAIGEAGRAAAFGGFAVDEQKRKLRTALAAAAGPGEAGALPAQTAVRRLAARRSMLGRVRADIGTVLDKTAPGLARRLRRRAVPPK